MGKARVRTSKNTVHVASIALFQTISKWLPDGTCILHNTHSEIRVTIHCHNGNKFCTLREAAKNTLRGGVLITLPPSEASGYSPHFFLPLSILPLFFLLLSILPSFFPLPKYTPPIFLLLQVSSPHSSSCFIDPSPTVEYICMWPPPISKIATPEFDASNTQFLWRCTFLSPFFWNKYLTPPILELFRWNVLSPPIFLWNGTRLPQKSTYLICTSPKISLLSYTSPKNDQFHLHSPILGENHLSSRHFMSPPPPPRQGVFGTFPYWYLLPTWRMWYMNPHCQS